MSLLLSAVDMSDVEYLARHVHIPAMRNSTLYQIMFPHLDGLSEGQQEEIVRWDHKMLHDAVEERHESFLKVSNVEGTPLDFCGWIVVNRCEQREVKASAGTENRQSEKKNWISESMDIESWIAVSMDKKKERERTLANLGNICSAF
jgi:hypothetical protein